MTLNGPAKSQLKPLGNSSQINTAVSTPKRSATGKRDLFTAALPGSSMALSNLQAEYNALERNYADLLLRTNALSVEKHQIERELREKAETIAQQAEKLANYESLLVSLKKEHAKNQELYERELYYYKELVHDVEAKCNKLSAELEQWQQGQHKGNVDYDISAENKAALAEATLKYTQLMRDFKVLQSNFEIEQNSKLVLMDQIEYLTHNSSPMSNDALRDQVEDDELASKDVHIDTYHTLNALHGQSDTDDSDFEAATASQTITNLADEIISSSPIKQDIRVPSLEHNSGFRFPPSPDPVQKQPQRQSLPAKIKTSPHLDLNEFVLSPLKLTVNHNASNLYFDLTDASISKPTKRYSTTKPNHSRYNSHDIFPIKVEFEQLDGALRSTSVPERVHNDRASAPEQTQLATPSTATKRNSAFFVQNILESTLESKRNSTITESSSKRSSLIIDQSMLTNDMTKQEIMKLKFELHSLKLHNEKLLSYIGFELQKQKKNIKRLSHKQSLNDMAKTDPKKMEYSDAKLIEKSREMLINKKRVLRSVSINPILSNKNTGLGITGLSNSDITSQLLDGEDEYGFMNYQNGTKYGSRVFDEEMKGFYDIDHDLDDSVLKLPKKYRLQTFRHKEYMSSDEDEDEGDGSLNEDDSFASSEWRQRSEHDGEQGRKPLLKEADNLSIFSSVWQVLAGNKARRGVGVPAPTVDESLKYKFFTIAVGIIIIGVRFSHQQAAQN